MQYPVYTQDENVGAFSCDIQGKTLTFSGKYAFFSGIHRFYAIAADGEILPLGVLMPEGEGLALRRTLRRRDAAALAGRLLYGVICPGDEAPRPIEPAAEKKPPELPTAETDAFAPPVIRLDRWLETDHPETLTEDPVLQETLYGAPGALYRYRGGRLRQLSTDQSLVQMLYADGTITKEEQKTHKFRNIISPVMGNDTTAPNPDVVDLGEQMQYGDLLLLCTDGLSDYVPSSEIEEILALPAALPKRLGRLVDRAVANGGRDNITVIAAAVYT